VRARRLAAANAALEPDAITLPHAMPIRNGARRAVVSLEESPWRAPPQVRRTAAVGRTEAARRRPERRLGLPRRLSARTPCGAGRHLSV